MANKHSTSKLPRWEGFANYPTWNVNLWLQNEEPSYRYWTSRAKQVLEYVRTCVPAEDVHRKAVYALAVDIQGAIESHVPELEGTYADLLNWALCYVDWCEVASQFLTEEE